MKALLILLAPLALAACDQKMAAAPRDKAFTADTAFADGASVRPPVAGTIAQEDEIAPGRAPPLTAALIQRGHERYDIFCSPCHSRTGDGDGLVVRRGFPHPPSFGEDALRTASDRHIFDVITFGYGVMYPYGSRVPPADRWAIVAYVRALQLAGHAEVAALPDDLRGKAEATP